MLASATYPCRAKAASVPATAHLAFQIGAQGTEELTVEAIKAFAAVNSLPAEYAAPFMASVRNMLAAAGARPVTAQTFFNFVSARERALRKTFKSLDISTLVSAIM